MLCHPCSTSGLGGVKFAIESLWMLLSSLLLGGGIARIVMRGTDAWQPVWHEGTNEGDEGDDSVTKDRRASHRSIMHTTMTAPEVAFVDNMRKFWPLFCRSEPTYLSMHKKTG
jgi:hypothetical protein